jgi:O-antigen/teichoic acid export membrane protein
MFHFGFSMFIVSTFWSTTQHITGIVISHDLGVLWQGYFDVSFTLVSLLSFAFLAMQFISIPEATSTKNKKDILFKSGGLGDVVKGLFSLLILCIILLYFYSTQFVVLLFTEKYIVAADYMIILAIGYVFLFIQQFLVYLNISLSEDVSEYKPLVLITIIFLIMSPFITHFLIRLIGFLGAYISFTLLLVLYALATIIYSKDLSPLYALFHNGSRLIIASLITFFLLYFLKPTLIYGLIASIFIYALLIFLLGYLDKELVLGLYK